MCQFYCKNTLWLSEIVDQTSEMVIGMPQIKHRSANRAITLSLDGGVKCSFKLGKFFTQLIHQPKHPPTTPRPPPTGKPCRQLLRVGVLWFSHFNSVAFDSSNRLVVYAQFSCFHRRCFARIVRNVKPLYA